MVDDLSAQLDTLLALLRGEPLPVGAPSVAPLLLLAGVSLVVLVGVLWLGAARRRRLSALAEEARLSRQVADQQFAELKGRLQAMAEMTAQRQSEQVSRFDDRLDHVSQRLGDALDAMARRVGDSLADTHRQSGETVQRLNERIDSLSRHLGQSLDTVSARLGDNLVEAGRRTSESLSTLNERLAVIADAKQSLAALSSDVLSLQGVLADKQSRGAFGQMQMETIIRDMLPLGAYEFQATLSNGKRPDCLIRLPNTPQGLVIDSKFPLEGFEALRVARTADEVKQASAQLREAVGRHIDDIAGKYLIAGETQDTALMFVPSESIYADLHERFSDLVQRAHRARIVIVAPNVLMLAVQTVQALIKDAKMRDQAGLIQREVGLLLEDVQRLAERAADLERHFGLSHKSLEKLQHSANKIASRGERLVTLDLDEPIADDRPQIARAK